MYCHKLPQIAKAHSQRAARLQLIANMLKGQSWQEAMANAGLSIRRATAYRLVQLARDPERGRDVVKGERTQAAGKKLMDMLPAKAIT